MEEELVGDNPLRSGSNPSGSTAHLLDMMAWLGEERTEGNDDGGRSAGEEEEEERDGSKRFQHDSLDEDAADVKAHLQDVSDELEDGRCGAGRALQGGEARSLRRGRVVVYES